MRHGHRPQWSKLLLLSQGKQGVWWDWFGDAEAGSVPGCPAGGTSLARAAGTWWLCPGETCPSTSTLPIQSPSLNAADRADARCSLPDELSFIISCNRTWQLLVTQTSARERSSLYLPLLIPIFSPPFPLDCVHMSLSEVFSSDMIAVGQRSAFAVFNRAPVCELCIQPVSWTP